MLVCNALLKIQILCILASVLTALNDLMNDLALFKMPLLTPLASILSCNQSLKLFNSQDANDLGFLIDNIILCF